MHRFGARLCPLRAGPALPFHGRQGDIGPAALGRLLDSGVNLAKAAVEVCNLAGSDLDLGRKGCILRLDGREGNRSLLHSPRRSDYQIGFPRVIAGALCCAPALSAPLFSDILGVLPIH